ncbi:unnamed protein product, partial [Coregonus sp. 'balchen']
VGFRKGGIFLLNPLGRRMEMVLAGVLLVSVLALCGCAVTLGSRRYNKDPAQSLCLTKACITVANKIEEALDRSADPCQDFYQYACGGWVRKNPLPDGRSRWSTLNSVWNQNQALLKHLLENGTFNSSSEAERKTQFYYLSCLNEQHIEELGATPLINLITK